MRPRFLISILSLALAIFAIIYWLRPARHTGVPDGTPMTAASTNTSTVAVSVPSQNASAQPQISVQSQTFQQREASPDEKAVKALQEYNSSHYQPIFFYGQVIDQSSNPVAGAEVNVSILQSQVSAPTVTGDFPITNNLLRLALKTGVDGRFEITGESGGEIDFESIQKEGFEIEPIKRARGPQEGSIDRPIIFKMWSTNIHEQLITGDYKFQIVPDGRLYGINLSKGAIGESGGGDLQVWVKRPMEVTQGQRYDWACEIDTAEGGLLEVTNSDAPMYLAPFDDYTPSYKFKQNIGSGWGDSTGSKRFYVKLRNGQEYGRIIIELEAYYNDQIPGMIRLSYAINPSGSQILR
jgi:hypothetical protein